MPSILSTVRDIERLRQIVLVLGRHGFGEIVQRSGLGRMVKRGADTEPPPPVEVSPEVGVGARLRMVLQDLGPSFVKLGQILSTRPDVIPPDIIEELKKLQDRVPPVAFSELRSEVENELGAGIDEIFASFDEQPLASASIAQVHRAQLRVERDGEEVLRDVVVKIQRPKIKSIVDRDLDLLFIVARLLERGIPEARIYAPTGLVSEFARAISAELDFTREADHADRFRKNFSDHPHARFPEVMREASARKVLTLEFLDGDKLPIALERGHSGPVIAKRMLHLLFSQIFEDGFFHGDPHPGNILILGEVDDPVLGLIDLGLVGRLSPELRDKTVDLMVAAARQDSQGVADALYAIGRPTRRIDRHEYTQEVVFLAEKYLGKPLKEIEVSSLIRDIVQGAVKYGLEIPPEFLMLARTLMTVEGVGKELDPNLDVLTESRPFFVELLKRRFSPERLGGDLLRTLARISGSATGLPEKLGDILEDLRRGDLVVRTVDPSLRLASDVLGRRIFSGLTVASLICGGSLMIARGDHAALPGFIMLGGAVAWLVGHLGRMAIKAARQRGST